jgi:hypothetical protein
MCSGQEVKHYSGSHIVKHEILLAPHLMTKKITLFPIHRISSTGHREPQLVQQISNALSSKSEKISYAKLLEQKLNQRFAQYTEFQERLNISSYTQLLEFFKKRYENNKFGCLAHDCMHYDKDYRIETEHYMQLHISKKFFACVHDSCQAVFQSKKMLLNHVKNCKEGRM